MAKVISEILLTFPMSETGPVDAVQPPSGAVTLNSAGQVLVVHTPGLLPLAGRTGASATLELNHLQGKKNGTYTLVLADDAAYYITAANDFSTVAGQYRAILRVTLATGRTLTSNPLILTVK